MSTRFTPGVKHRTKFHIHAIWHRVSEWAGSSGRWLWHRIREQITPFRVIAVLFGIPVLWYVYREAVRDVILIDSITVPKQYEDLGYGSSAITLRVAEKLEQIEQGIQSRSKKDRLLQGADIDVPDIEVPTTKLSLKTVVHLFQQVLHHEPTHVRGEITFSWTQSSSNRVNQPIIVWYHIYNGTRLRWAEKDELHTANPDEVVQQYAEGLLKRLNPYLWAVYVGLNKHDFPGAIAVSETVIRESHDPKLRSKAYNLIGYLLHLDNNDEEAIDKYRNAIRLDKTYPIPYNNLGNALYADDKEQAIDNYRKAIELDPNYALAYNNLGNALDHKGNYDEAITMYRKAATINPKYAFAYNGLGNALYHERRYNEAVENYRKAIKLDPNYAFAYQGLASALKDQGKYTDAGENYDRAITLSPDYGLAYRNWSDALRAQGRLEEAKEKFQKAIELDPTLAHSQ